MTVHTKTNGKSFYNRVGVRNDKKASMVTELMATTIIFANAIKAKA